MGKIAFVFPGQGAQKVGMGQAAYETAAGKEVFDEADTALGEKLSRLCFEGPDEQLKLTANTQPAILSVSVALLRGFGERPDAVAGHSLGEYSANVCAGTCSFGDAVKTVRKRGQYMQEAVPVGQGAMAAVMGLGRADIDELVEEVTASAGLGDVQAVNYNSPQQTVIAGSAGAVEKAGGLLKEKGGKVIPLPVSAPFHSRLMEPAEQRLAPDLQAVNFADATCPIYVNVDAVPVTSGEAARDALVRQVARPVRWQETIEHMLADGVTLFVEVGPGKVLQGLIGRIAKDAKRVGVSSPNDFEAAREAIQAARG